MDRTLRDGCPDWTPSMSYVEQLESENKILLKFFEDVREAWYEKGTWVIKDVINDAEKHLVVSE